MFEQDNLSYKNLRYSFDYTISTHDEIYGIVSIIQSPPMMKFMV